MEIDIEEYRARLRKHAERLGYHPPEIKGRFWVFESPEGANKILPHEPIFPLHIEDCSEMLRTAKSSLTREQNKARKK